MKFKSFLNEVKEPGQNIGDSIGDLYEGDKVIFKSVEVNYVTYKNIKATVLEVLNNWEHGQGGLICFEFEKNVNGHSGQGASGMKIRGKSNRCWNFSGDNLKTFTYEVI